MIAAESLKTHETFRTSQPFTAIASQVPNLLTFVRPWHGLSAGTCTPQFPNSHGSLRFHAQAHADGSNEAGKDEKPSIAVSQAIAAEVKNGYTMNVHNGDLAYADGFLADWDNYYGGVTTPEKGCEKHRSP